jgi:hypothetical protein
MTFHLKTEIRHTIAHSGDIQPWHARLLACNHYTLRNGLWVGPVLVVERKAVECVWELPRHGVRVRVVREAEEPGPLVAVAS